VAAYNIVIYNFWTGFILTKALYKARRGRSERPLWCADYVNIYMISDEYPGHVHAPRLYVYRSCMRRKKSRSEAILASSLYQIRSAYYIMQMG